MKGRWWHGLEQKTKATFNLNDLADVNETTASLNNGDLLQWNGLNWVGGSRSWNCWAKRCGSNGKDYKFGGG